MNIDKSGTHKQGLFEPGNTGPFEPGSIEPIELGELGERIVSPLRGLGGYMILDSLLLINSS